MGRIVDSVVRTLLASIPGDERQVWHDIECGIPYQTLPIPALGQVPGWRSHGRRLGQLGFDQFQFTGARVLDVGAANLTMSIEAMRRGANWTLAVDLDEQAMAVGRQLMRIWGTTVITRHGDVFSLPLDTGKFDIVFCCSVVKFVDGQRLFQYLAKRMKKNAMMLFEGHREDGDAECDRYEAWFKKAGFVAHMMGKSEPGSSSQALARPVYHARKAV